MVQFQLFAVILIAAAATRLTWQYENGKVNNTAKDSVCESGNLVQMLLMEKTK